MVVSSPARRSSVQDTSNTTPNGYYHYDSHNHLECCYYHHSYRRLYSIYEYYCDIYYHY